MRDTGCKALLAGSERPHSHRLTATMKSYALFIMPPEQPMSTMRSQSTSSAGNNGGRGAQCVAPHQNDALMFQV